MDYFLDAFRKYAEFAGRTTRKEYWSFYLLFTVASVVLWIVDFRIGKGLFLTSIFNVIATVPQISITARRLHDTGRSGWWQLILLVPIIGWIVLLVFVSQQSHADNIYGPKPLQH